MKYDIFISYRRDSGEYTAKILRDRLGELSYNVFFDVEALRSGDFNTKLYSVIDECTDFIIVLSPGCLDRCANDDDWVRREIEYALEKGKNIVPVLLRGFTFPKSLPKSIEAIRYRNGIEANSEFFDAFIEKLQSFLVTKVSFTKRLGAKFFIRLAAGALLAAALIFGGINIATRLNTDTEIYPQTAAQKSFTGEVLYYTQSNLLALDQIGNNMTGAISAAKRYLSSSDGDLVLTENSLENYRAMIELVDENNHSPTDEFLVRLGESPFEAADFIAMHDIVSSFKQECLGNIDFITQVISDDFYASNTYKLEVLEYYETMVAESLNIYGLCCNQMLLPISNDDSLSEFKQEFLPLLCSIPLKASAWSDSYDDLQSDIDKSSMNMSVALNNYSSLIGNLSVESNNMRRDLVNLYIEMGYTPEEAKAIVEEILRDAN